MSTLLDILGPEEGGRSDVDDEPIGGPSIDLPPQMHHLSASSMNMLDRCPEQFRHRYILKKREAPGVARLLGSVEWGTHVEGNFRQKLESGADVKWPELEDFFHHTWEEKIEEEGGVTAFKWEDDKDGGNKKPDQWRELGLKMTETYHRDVSPKLQPIEMEEKFEMAVAGVGVPIIGYRDLVARPADLEDDVALEHAHTVEHKTAKQKQSSLKPDWFKQGRIYQLFEPLPVAFHVVTKNVTPKVWTPAGTSVTEPLEGLLLPLLGGEAKFETERMIVRSAQTIAAFYSIFGPDEPWPTTGTGHTWACGWCAWRPSCPAWKGVPR